MIRRLIAVTALGGTLALGGAGVASAATTSASATSQYNCANAPSAISRINANESKEAASVTKAEGRLATATKNHHPRVAHLLQREIRLLKRLEARGQHRLAHLSAVCLGGSTTPTTSSPAVTSS